MPLLHGGKSKFKLIVLRTVTSCIASLGISYPAPSVVVAVLKEVDREDSKCWSHCHRCLSWRQLMACLSEVRPGVKVAVKAGRKAPCDPRLATLLTFWLPNALTVCQIRQQYRLPETGCCICNAVCESVRLKLSRKISIGRTAC